MPVFCSSSYSRSSDRSPPKNCFDNARRKRAALFWATIIATTTLGTTLADFADRSLSIGYSGGVAIVGALLAASLLIWRWSEGTVSVASINTPKAQWYYWCTILFAQTLATALRDWLAGSEALVFELSKVDTLAIRQAMVGHLLNIDADLAQRVADGLGLKSMPAAVPSARPVIDMDASPALQTIGKAKATLKGRCVAILVNDGSDGATIRGLQDAVLAAGATVKIVAPKVGGVTLADGKHLDGHAQLAGAPSVLFDAVAIVLSTDGAAELLDEAAAVDFVRDAFGHLKAIAHDAGAQDLLVKAGITPDAGVLKASDTKAFIKMAMTRQWAREPKVRMLA